MLKPWPMISSVASLNLFLILFSFLFVFCSLARAEQLGHNEIIMEVTISSSANNDTISYKIEPLPNGYAELGEGPHWDVATQNLYYVDIDSAKLLRYNYPENKVYSCKIEGEIRAGFVVPIENTSDKFAVGCERRVVIVTWDGVSPTCKVEKVLFTVQDGDERFTGNRFNDGKCDPRGRLFAGTVRYIGDMFEYRYGELYVYDKGNISVVKTDVGISNGLAWNEKTKKFYYIDTADYEVKEYDYDFEKGLAKNPKVIFDLRKLSKTDKILPDGMTIDTEGNIYVATFNGHTIYKVNPNNGQILLEIKFPCKQITSAAWGGPNLDILYVTTSSLFEQPAPAGSTYKVTGLGAKGFPMSRMQI